MRGNAPILSSLVVMTWQSTFWRIAIGWHCCQLGVPANRTISAWQVKCLFCHAFFSKKVMGYLRLAARLLGVCNCPSWLQRTYKAVSKTDRVRERFHVGCHAVPHVIMSMDDAKTGPILKEKGWDKILLIYHIYLYRARERHDWEKERGTDVCNC